MPIFAELQATTANKATEIRGALILLYFVTAACLMYAAAAYAVRRRFGATVVWLLSVLPVAFFGTVLAIILHQDPSSIERKMAVGLIAIVTISCGAVPIVVIVRYAKRAEQAAWWKQILVATGWTYACGLGFTAVGFGLLYLGVRLTTH